MFIFSWLIPLESGNLMVTQTELNKFNFLKKLAFDLGAEDAKVIPASKVVVENRIVLKCKIGCSKYGKTMMCPPHTPTAEEFKRIVSEYKYALFVKFISAAEIDDDLRSYLSKPENEIPEDMKEKSQKFWNEWKNEKTRLLNVVLDLEKEAVHNGYPLPFGLISGSCQLCEKCSLKQGSCLHPDKARFSEEAVGVNVKATAENAGIKFTFPSGRNPESFGLLLID